MKHEKNPLLITVPVPWSTQPITIKASVSVSALIVLAFTLLLTFVVF